MDQRNLDFQADYKVSGKMVEDRLILGSTVEPRIRSRRSEEFISVDRFISDPNKMAG